MPTHKGVEVWIEDSEHRRVSHQEITINLVDLDDQTVTVKTGMSRDEPYSVHCLSPASVFCDVFVTTGSRVRNLAARFYLDKSAVVSETVSGSSTDHAIEQFREHGLRTPRRQFQRGKLGTVEVEIRRISGIIKGEHKEGYETDEDEGVDFMMIDEPDQPPWLLFRFDISVKALLVQAPVSTAQQTGRRGARRVLVNQSRTTGSGNDKSLEIGHVGLRNSRKHPKEHDVHNGSSRVSNLDRIQQEYLKEEAEEQRLLEKLQERLQTKKVRNMELRRLLGEPA